jgi:hypothetical protein
MRDHPALRGHTNKPVQVAPDAWYYEEAGGLHIYYGQGGRAGELICVLPWRKLNASMKRHAALAGEEP